MGYRAIHVVALATAVALAAPRAVCQVDVFPGRTYPVGVGTFVVELGDVNGDGVPDAAIGKIPGGPITVFVNSGSGHFTASGTIALTGSSADLLVLDMTQDGLADIVSTPLLGSDLHVVPGAAGGGTISATSRGAAAGRAAGLAAGGVTVAVEVDRVNRPIVYLPRVA